MVLGPEAFFRPWTIFHLNAIRWIQEHGDASSHDQGCGFRTNPGTVLYPAGWHDFVYLIYNTTGTSIATATIVRVPLVGGRHRSLPLIAMCLEHPAFSPGARYSGVSTCGFFCFPGLPLFWGAFLNLGLCPAPLPLWRRQSHMIQVMVHREYRRSLPVPDDSGGPGRPGSRRTRTRWFRGGIRRAHASAVVQMWRVHDAPCVNACGYRRSVALDAFRCVTALVRAAPERGRQ